MGSPTPPIKMVLTMGRVASTAVQQSAEEQLGERVFHVHSIDPSYLARQVHNWGGPDKVGRSVRDGLELVAKLVNYPGRVKVVTLVREPIGRAYSAAFAAFHKAFPSPDEMEAVLADAARFDPWWANFNDQRPITWFDQQIRQVLDIDVFEVPFPEPGSITFHTPRCDLLVMRSELGDGDKEKVLAEFFEVDGLTISRRNESGGTERWNGLYGRFRDQAELSDEHRRLLLESSYNRHFYGT